MTTARFICTMVEPFGIVELRQWAEGERAFGRIPAKEAVSIQVVHLDREAEGSCRWCGCRENESITVEPTPAAKG